MEEQKEEEARRSSRSYPVMADEAAEYHKLVQSSDFFLQKLKDFHASFNTHFMSPSIGGITLDLHRLFVEVTSRGGLDKVISDRKWEEVVSAFTFATTGFKTSFVLRKYYLSLLYHFEQAYFLKKKAPAVAITDAAEQITVTGSSIDTNSDFDEESHSMSHSQANVQLQPGASLIGVIDEKLDNGAPRRRRRKKSQLSLVEYATLKPTSQGQEKSLSYTGPLRNQISKPEKQSKQ